MEKVLITGGRGLVGSAITELLLKNGYDVQHISRKRRPDDDLKVWEWDLKKGWIEEGALDGAYHIIHLAGANIGSGRFNEAGIARLRDSRIASAGLLYDEVHSKKIELKSFISASAIGYYDMRERERTLAEDEPPGEDVIAKMVVDWEAAADRFTDLCRVSKVRIGLVLDKDSGALPKIAMPVKFGLGANLGDGRQWMPWIHISDIAGIFHFILKNGLEGVFNGVAPDPQTNNTFNKVLAKVLKRPLFLPGIPKALLKMALGKKAGLILNGSKISCERIKSAGYEFNYNELRPALEEIYS